MASWAERFAVIRDRHRRDDGSRWSGAALERATGGRVSRNYVSKLGTGRVEDPSFEKIWAISRAMGVPLEEWVEGEPGFSDVRSGPEATGGGQKRCGV